MKTRLVQIGTLIRRGGQIGENDRCVSDHPVSLTLATPPVLAAPRLPITSDPETKHKKSSS